MLIFYCHVLLAIIDQRGYYHFSGTMKQSILIFHNSCALLICWITTKSDYK